MIGYFFHFLILISCVLLTGCKAGEKVLSNLETTTEIRQRVIPVPIPERKADVTGLINVDKLGNLTISDLSVDNDKGTAVDIELSEDGRFKATFKAVKDTASVAVTDTIIKSAKEQIKQTEIKQSIWVKLSKYASIILLAATFIIMVFWGIKIYKAYKELWQ